MARRRTSPEGEEEARPTGPVPPVRPSPTLGRLAGMSLGAIARKLAQGRPALAGWCGPVDCPTCRAVAESEAAWALVIVHGALATLRLDCRRCGYRAAFACPVRKLLAENRPRWTRLPS